MEISNKNNEVNVQKIISSIRDIIRSINAQEYEKQIPMILDLSTYAAKKEIVEYENIDEYDLIAEKILLSRAVNSGEVPLSSYGHSALGTVWERNDLFTRIFIEEGKVNLIIRIMIRVSEDVKTNKTLLPLLYALDIMIAALFNTIETIQTVDLIALLEHISNQFKTSTEAPTSFLSHESFLIAILGKMMCCYEKLNCQERIIDAFINEGIFNYVLLHLSTFRDDIIANKIEIKIDEDENPLYPLLPAFFKRNFPSSYLMFFTFLVESEDFKSRQNEFFATKEDKKKFASIISPLVDSLIKSKSNQLMKKALRPLNDIIIRYN